MKRQVSPRGVQQNPHALRELPHETSTEREADKVEVKEAAQPRRSASLLEEEANMIDPKSLSTFSPIQISPSSMTSPMARDSPNTFVSYNRANIASYATTSEEEDNFDFEVEEEDDGTTEDGMSTDCSNNGKVIHHDRPVPRMLFDADDSDSSSTLSSQTHKIDTIPAGIPKGTEELTADCPPNPPVRTPTQEDATKMKVDVHAKTEEHEPDDIPLKQAPVGHESTSDDLQSSLQHRLAGPYKEVRSPKAAAAAAVSVGPITPSGQARSMSELEDQSKKHAATRPLVMTRRMPASAKSSRPVAGRQSVLGSRANTGAFINDRASLEQASSRTSDTSLDHTRVFSGEHGARLSTKKPSPLQAALLARNASRTPGIHGAQITSRAQDRAASKATIGERTSDDDDGPQLAPANLKPPPRSRPQPALQDSLGNDRGSQSRFLPSSMQTDTRSKRLALKMAQEDEASDEDQGPQLALAPSRKKPPPMIAPSSTSTTPRGDIQPSLTLNTSHSFTSRTVKTQQKMKPVLQEAETSRALSQLEAAMQARHAGRSPHPAMPTAVSRDMDRAGAKMESAHRSTEKEHNVPKLTVDDHATKARPSALQVAMQAREVSRAIDTPLPMALDQAMDRAGAKMADSEQGPELSTPKIEPPSNLRASAQSHNASDSSPATTPFAFTSATDREEHEGPQLAASTSRMVGPHVDLHTAMQARATSRTRSMMPEHVSRAMDRAGEKIGDDQSDDEGFPQLATARRTASKEHDDETGSFGLDEKKCTLSATAASGNSCRRKATASKDTPGAVSCGDKPVGKELEEYDGGDDEGPTLAAPVAVDDNEWAVGRPSTRDYLYSCNAAASAMASQQIAIQRDSADVPSLHYNDRDIEEAYDERDDDEITTTDIQEGLVVTEGQAGAYAVQGIEGTGEDDLYHDAFDPTNVVPEAQAPVTAVSLTTAATAVIVPNFDDVAPLQAELFDQPLVQGDIYEEHDLVDDPKFQRKLRIMQVIILCTSLLGIVFVIISVIAGLDQTSEGMPFIKGWRSIGNPVFGPDREESQVFFGASTAISANGRRIVVSAPGTDVGDTFNSGAIYVLGESVDESSNATWQVLQRIDGPGESEVLMSPVTMASSGTRIAVGYPFFDGGKVQVFEEGEVWLRRETISMDSNNTKSESWFGYAIDMSDTGEYLAIGAPRDVSKGSVRVYRRETGGAWVSIGRPIPAKNTGELFGWSISLVQTPTLRVAVGAPSHDTETGLVRVYDLIGSEWIQVGDTLHGESVLNRFGETCALSTNGMVLAVGIRGSPFEKGKVRIYRQIQGDWVEDKQVIQGTESGGGFGSALSMTPDGNTLAIGGPGNNAFGQNSGHIQVWSYDGSVWTMQGSSIGGETNVAYGSSVALTSDGRRVVGGAPRAAYDSSVPENGYVRVYDRDETAARI